MNMKHLVLTAACVVLAAVLSGAADAGDWPDWRGPNHNGGTDERDLPTQWSATKNVLWAADMPGVSSATPVVSGERVFVVSSDKSLTTLSALCLHRDTGEVLWRKELVQGAKGTAQNGMASCSPVTDGEVVYFLFGTGDFFAFDFEGNEVWSKNLVDEFGPIGQQFGYSSSPLLYKNKLYLAILRGQWAPGADWSSYTDKDSHVVCLDAATGEVEWKVHRPTDAVGESFDSYASLIPYESGETAAIVVIGGDYLTGYDPSTGEELWRYCNNPEHKDMWRIIPSPVVVGDLICGVQPRGLDAFAIRPGGKAEMAYTDARWIYREKTTDVPTPLFYEGRLYILNGVRRMMMCLDPATGKEIWRGTLEGSKRIWASPTAADGKIYCLDEAGTTTVLAAGSKFKILGQSRLGGSPAKSTIAIADGKLFVRTAEKLYCVGAGR